jgi:hypothetical protein
LRRILLAHLCLALGACATVVSGTQQDVEIVSDPPGAECRVMAGTVELARTVTPGTVRLERQEDDLAVQCRLEGHRATAAILHSGLQGVTAGNMILGGMVGLAIDSASGANHLYDSSVRVALRPLAGASAEAESWESLAARAMSGASLHRLPVGAVVWGTPRLGRARVPLPPGDWIVAGRDRGTSTGPGIPYARVVLLQIGAANVDRAIFLTANLTGAGPWGRPADCGSRAIHAAVTVREDTRGRECWWVSHYVRGVPTERSWAMDHELHAFLTERRLRMPTMVTAGFFVTDTGGMLQAIYAFRPGAAGLPDEGGVRWDASRWRPAASEQDPRRARLIAWQKEWAAALQPAFRHALDGGLREVPPLPMPPR